MSSSEIRYTINKATENEIRDHLHKCANDFNPPLYSYVDIDAYGSKIFVKSTRFEAWDNLELVGLGAVYYNDPEAKVAFFTHLDILKQYQGGRVAYTLISKVIRFGLERNFIRIETEIYPHNNAMQGLVSRVQGIFGVKAVFENISHPDGQGLKKIKVIFSMQNTNAG